MFNIRKFLNLNYYISELDQFLTHFKRTHPQLSDSQLAEKRKYDRIINLRDKPADQQKPSTTLWEKF